MFTAGEREQTNDRDMRRDVREVHLTELYHPGARIKKEVQSNQVLAIKVSGPAWPGSLPTDMTLPGCYRNDEICCE